jgi:hypothetical protein
MSRGLGKLERFIILHSWRKKLMVRHPGEWIFSHSLLSFEHKIDRDMKEIFGDRYQDTMGDEKESFLRLYKHEVLANYPGFDLTFSEKLARFGRIKFKVGSNYRIAQASYTRVTKRLEEKGLIERLEGGDIFNEGFLPWRGVELTEKGAIEAKRILSREPSSSEFSYLKGRDVIKLTAEKLKKIGRETGRMMAEFSMTCQGTKPSEEALLYLKVCSEKEREEIFSSFGYTRKEEPAITLY